MKFTLLKKDYRSKARCGLLETAHGRIETPIFMPVGTRAAVKTMTNEELYTAGAQIILANTYHLMLRPGMNVMQAAGGLHKFMNWKRPILTDSGGYQVFSLSSLNKITDAGVLFHSHIDGSKHFLGPKESMEIQRIIGSDIVMAFDECTHHPCEKSHAEVCLRRTTEWAKVCRDAKLDAHQNLFGIVQGSIFPELRARAAKEIVALDFPGYAIGGLSVGEPAEIMNEMCALTAELLPEEKPRYLMGVGTPRNLIESVMRGVDMFDCVMPTRNARNGQAFTWTGKHNISSAKYAIDFTPMDEELGGYPNTFSRAYIRHLLNVDEITGLTLVTWQNISFYLDLMKKIRLAILEDRLDELYKKVCALYPN